MKRQWASKWFMLKVSLRLSLTDWKKEGPIQKGWRGQERGGQERGCQDYPQRWIWDPEEPIWSPLLLGHEEGWSDCPEKPLLCWLSGTWIWQIPCSSGFHVVLSLHHGDQPTNAPYPTVTVWGHLMEVLPSSLSYYVCISSAWITLFTSRT